MNAGTFSGSARIIVTALVLATAVVLGLIVGNAIGQRDDTARTNLGYPPGWHGGAAVPAAQTSFGYPTGWNGGAAVSAARTADVSFSLEAIEQLSAIRANDRIAAAASSDDGSDYGLRHPSSADEKHALPRSGQRKAANDGEASLTAPTPR